MATTEEYKNGGSASYSFAIEYIKAEDIKVAVDGTNLTYTATNPPAQTTEYTVNGSNVIFKQASVSGSATGGVRIYRETALENVDSATFQEGSAIRAADLNANHKLVKFSAQEKNQEIVTADVRDQAITSDKIANGTIVDQDINGNAAIDGTKIAPNFGSQNITTTGNISTSGTVNNLTNTELAILDGATVSTAELNTLDGITASTAELNYTDGVTSNIQTQLDNKQPLDAELTELATMSSGTASALADLTGTEVSILDGATISTTQLNNLQNIEPAAKDDQTGAEIKALYEAEAQTNAFTDAEKAKLANLGSLNSLSDVNTSGVADGKILKYDASASEFIIADDGGSGSGGATAFTGLSDTPSNYGNAAGKTLKINSTGNAVEFVDVSTDLLQDGSPQLAADLDVQNRAITTSTTNQNIVLTPNGTGSVEVRGNGSTDGAIVLNCGNNTHGQTIKAPPHSAGVSNTFTLPTAAVSGINQNAFLKTDTNGQLSFDSTTYLAANQQIIGSSLLFNNTNQNIVFDTDGNNTHTISFVAPGTLTKTSAFTLPEDGTAGTPLQTNGSGGLSFADIDKIKEGSSSVEITGDGGTSDGVFEVKLQDATYSGAAKTSLKQYTSSSTNVTELNAEQAEIQSKLKLWHNTGTNAWGDIEFAQSGTTSGTSKIRSNGHSYIELHPTSTSGAKFGVYDVNIVANNPLLPGHTNTHTLGSSGLKWSEVHATTFYGSGANLTDIDAGATGSGNDKIFWENGQTITTSYTVGTTFGAACNAMSAGPITINNSVVVTVDSGDTWTIV